MVARQVSFMLGSRGFKGRIVGRTGSNMLGRVEGGTLL